MMRVSFLLFSVLICLCCDGQDDVASKRSEAILERERFEASVRLLQFQQSRPPEYRARDTVRKTSYDTDPFKENPTIGARLGLLGDESPGLKWHNTREGKEINGKFEDYPLRDHLLKLMRASEEEIREVDSLFEARMKSHEQNLLILKGADGRERDLLRRDNGAPLFVLKHLDLPELPKKTIDGLLVAYSKLERKAESTLYDELTQVIDPLQFETYVHRWVTVYALYIPLAAKYLDLTDDQVREIKEASLAASKLMQENNRKSFEPGRDREQFLKDFFSTERWQETFFGPFSKLNPKQFRMAASFLLPGWRTCRSFEERLANLENDKSVAGKCELKVLGELYHEGMALEKKSQVK